MSTLEGHVDAVNGTGLRLGGEWLNLSKFKPVPLPPAGARVRVEVDAKGFIKSITVLDETATPAAPHGRDTTITRLAVLKAAAGFACQIATVREDVRSEHVLRIADAWLAWIEERP